MIAVFNEVGANKLNIKLVDKDGGEHILGHKGEIDSSAVFTIAGGEEMQTHKEAVLNEMKENDSIVKITDLSRDNNGGSASMKDTRIDVRESEITAKDRELAEQDNAHNQSSDNVPNADKQILPDNTNQGKDNKNDSSSIDLGNLERLISDGDSDDNASPDMPKADDVIDNSSTPILPDGDNNAKETSSVPTDSREATSGSVSASVIEQLLDETKVTPTIIS